MAPDLPEFYKGLRVPGWPETWLGRSQNVTVRGGWWLSQPPAGRGTHAGGSHCRPTTITTGPVTGPYHSGYRSTVIQAQVHIQGHIQ